MNFLPVNPQGIPESMRQLDHWHLWRWELNPKDGKYAKVPRMVGKERRASSTNPATWTTFSSTVDALQNNNGSQPYNGIGFAVEGSGYTFGDIDHCLDPLTGTIECPWVSAFITELNTYTERSPSGSGLHFWLQGTFTGPGKRVEFADGSALELYCRGRYSATTGVVFPGSPNEIRSYDVQSLYARLKSGQLGPDPGITAEPKSETESEAAPELREQLESWGLVIESEEPYQGTEEAGTRYKLQSCIFDPGHKDAAIFSYPLSTVYSCFHKSCEGKSWYDVLNKFEPVTSGNPASGNWRDRLLMGKKNEKTGKAKPLATLENAYLYLRYSPEWQGVLAFDQFSLNVITKKTPPCEPWSRILIQEVEDTLDGGRTSPRDDSWSDVDSSRATCWLQQEGVLVNSKLAHEALYMVARQRPFHPVRDYVRSLAWDQQPRLSNWLKDYLGCASGGPMQETYLTAVGRAVLIQAVTRVFRPGSKADYVFVLEGPQGIGKSQTCFIMFDPWFSDHLSDVNSKDARLELLGRWGIELGEFINRRSELERKSFVTSQVDSFRAPYERCVKQVPRQTVFWATTNDAQPLRDDTGGRRYWIVTCGQVNLAELKANKDQLWAEAYQAYRSGEPAWPVGEAFKDAATAEQESRLLPGPYDELILRWLERPVPRVYSENGVQACIEPFDSDREKTTITDVLLHALAKPRHSLNRTDQLSVRACLTHAGWRRDSKQTKIAGTNRVLYFYRRPQDEDYLKKKMGEED